MKEAKRIINSSTSTFFQEAPSEKELLEAAFRHLHFAFAIGGSHGSPASHGGCITFHRKRDFPKHAIFAFVDLVPGFNEGHCEDKFLGTSSKLLLPDGHAQN